MSRYHPPTAPGTLITHAGIQALLGVSRQRAHRLTEHPDFPAPLDDDGKGAKPIWARADVDAWVREHRGNGSE